MSAPIKVSKAAHASFEGEAWNALIDLISGNDPEELTPVQRTAHLAWVCSSEVLNGGHDQYFGNQEHLDHREVISALTVPGAVRQSEILKEALNYFARAQQEMPDDYEQYVAWDKHYGYGARMIEFDQRFYDCRPEIETELLEAYRGANESEFITWIS